MRPRPGEALWMNQRAGALHRRWCSAALGRGSCPQSPPGGGPEDSLGRAMLPLPAPSTLLVALGGLRESACRLPPWWEQSVGGT